MSRSAVSCVMATSLTPQLSQSASTHVSNHNNNNQFLYSGFHNRRASQSASKITTLSHWALIHSESISTPCGIYSLCNISMRYSAKSTTRTISALTVTRLPLGGEKQLQFCSVSCSGTLSVTTGIQTHTLLNRSTRIGALIRSAMTLQKSGFGSLH